MARKHLLTSIGAMPSEARAPKPAESRADYARKGASRLMTQSLDEIAENSMRILEGDAIVSLDPDVLDESPFSDRAGDDPDFPQFVEAIRKAGQSSPILVRPHPDQPGRFIIVFGHRRTRAARHLGIKVRAVVKPLNDLEEQIIAQGHENNARLNQTFIEKALFANRLHQAGIGKDIIKESLTIDDTLLSRMLSVVEHVPGDVLDALVPATGIGRDRWEELKKLVLNPEMATGASEIVRSEEFKAEPVETRFSSLCASLKQPKKRKAIASTPQRREWSLAGKAVKVAAKGSARAFTLELKAKDAPKFGDFLSTNLERLYQEFLESEGN
ncbi:plasmid partitioning protein RepB [Mesorhizobium sp. CAU 1732]|uniref:plasmid partitioning protein RepB n=1 Tax=Mesorhizobium sp. CAU 1732 TaxID=3140358 RepID=UPI0032609AB7